ncbi:hypothetical protein ACLOJK_009941 [Asimina triloba]
MSYVMMATKPAMTTEAIALTEKKMDMTLVYAYSNNILDIIADEIIKMSKKPSSKTNTHRASIRSRGFLNNVTSRGNAAKVQRFIDSRSSLRQGVLAQRRSNFQGKNQFPLAKEVARKAAIAPLRNRPGFHGLIRTYVVELARTPIPLVSVAVGMDSGNAERLMHISSFTSLIDMPYLLLAAVIMQVVVPTPVQTNPSENGFGVGRANVVLKQRPQTLDSLFANMKEQRMRVFTQQQTNGGQNIPRRQRSQQQQMRGDRGFRPAVVRPFRSFAK